MKKMVRSFLWLFAIVWVSCTGGEPDDEVQVASLVVEPSSLDLVRWQVGELQAEVRDEKGRPLAKVPVHWSAGDPSIASVDAGGRVRGLAPGETVLVARAGGRTVEVPVAVREAELVEIVLAPAIRVVEGATAALEVEVRDESGRRYPDLATAWEVEDPTVATVSEDGVIEGIARGKATTVTATVGELHATTEVQVISPLFYLSLEPAQLGVLQGKTAQLHGIPRDELLREVEERPLRWWSSDPAVVSVDDTGQVEGRAEGHAIVWAEGEGKRNYSLVDVLPRATKLDLQVSPTVLREGGRANLRAVATDDQGRSYPGLSFTWTSSDPSVVEVFGGQVVLANRVGTATLTAEQDEHGLRQSVTIQVKQGGELVVTGAAPGHLEAGATYELGLGFLQEDGTVIAAENPTFHSYDESVAIVDARGRARIVGVGRATIRIEAEGHTLSTDRLAVVRSRELALGRRGTCGLSRNGTAWCWGEKLLDRSGEYRGVVSPLPELAAEGLVAIRSGWGACLDFPLAGIHCDLYYGLTEAGGVVAWALGLPPIPVETGGPPYVAFDTFGGEICGVTASGALHCYGLPVSSGVTAVLTGMGGRCTFTAGGEASCQGQGAFDVDLSGHPIPPREGSFPISITQTHGCATTEDGTTLCWGENEAGQLGLEPDGAWHGPLALPQPMRAVATRPDVTIWVDREGALGATGQAWESPGNERDDYVDVRDLVDMEAQLSSYVPPGPLVSVFVGPGGHRCALTEAGRALCWGMNHRGQVGAIPRFVPFSDLALPVLLPISPYPEL